jgi:hypothetical protein
MSTQGKPAELYRDVRDGAMVPNPVTRVTPLRAYPGWVVREYRNGVYDATNGVGLSPGFDSFAATVSHVRTEVAGVSTAATGALNCCYCNRSFKWQNSLQRHEQIDCRKRPPATPTNVLTDAIELPNGSLATLESGKAYDNGWYYSGFGGHGYLVCIDGVPMLQTALRVDALAYVSGYCESFQGTVTA